MATRAAPIESPDVHSERLMKHAYAQLKRGDRLQASEKTWVAMAHCLKQIADEPGLMYDTHRDVNTLIRIVTRNSRFKESIIGGFTAANDLHRNFYDDIHERENLREYLRLVDNAIVLLNHEQTLWRERQHRSRSTTQEN